MKYFKRLSVIVFIWIVILNTIVFGDVVLSQKLDVDCYQEKCKIEKGLWDDINSLCVFLPKTLYSGGEIDAKKWGSFLNKKLASEEISLELFGNLLGFYASVPTFCPSVPSEERLVFLEFQCEQMGLTFGSEDCDKRFADNCLILMDETLLKSDMSLDKKDKINEIYRSCSLSVDTSVPSKSIFNSSFVVRIYLPSLLLPLFIAFLIILVYWVLYRKEENPFQYVKEGFYGFLISFTHFVISIITSVLIAYLNIKNDILMYSAFTVLPILGLITEFKLYKKTKHIRWKYALIFSIIFIINFIIVLYIFISILSINRKFK